MPQPSLLPLLLVLLVLGLAGAAPLSKQEVTRCLEEALKDKLAQGGPGEGPCLQLFQEDESLTSLLRTLEELGHQEISKHHLGPEHEAEKEEQEDFRKKKRGPGAPEGEKRLGQEVREEEEEREEVKAKEKSEIKEQEVLGQARVREEEEKRGPAETWLSQESFNELRKRRLEGTHGSEEGKTGAWDLEKRVAEKASDEETAQFEEEEKGVRVSGGGHSLWQGAGPTPRHHHHQPHPEQESEEEEEEEEAAEKKEQHELERLEQMGEELKRAAEALGRRG
ncbi:coiled-coil domain-containing glutamate-rich protein 2 [Monodelphis domestica]|uniref:coiled-coil domain-containing glutamate-rich protein 2 n=1 Tax=Monodelphis domestica TaxID=13616 RepID=UPI0024E1DD67|nr:coiled-coil domain-containing glutamate-rich protein 2 [Monodelphis domestica]